MCVCVCEGRWGALNAPSSKTFPHIHVHVLYSWIAYLSSSGTKSRVIWVSDGVGVP